MMLSGHPGWSDSSVRKPAACCVICTAPVCTEHTFGSDEKWRDVCIRALHPISYPWKLCQARTCSTTPKFDHLKRTARCFWPAWQASHSVFIV